MIPKSGLYSLTRLTTLPPDLSTPPLYPPYFTPSYIKASPMNPRFMCFFQTQCDNRSKCIAFDVLLFETHSDLISVHNLTQR